MSERPTLVSAVIPVHNGGAMLAEAVQSVLAQHLPPAVEVEVIVVDDGSVDGAPDALAAGVLVLSQENSGPSAARNVGVAAARGELVAFLDADDRWKADKLTSQVGHLAASGCDISLGHQQVHLLDGMPRPAWLDESPSWMPSAWRGRVAGQIQPATMVLRRDVFERVGGFDEGLRHGEDVDWMLRAVEAGLSVQVLDQVVVDRCVHRGNLSHDTAAMTRGMLSVLSRRAARTRGGAPDPTVAVSVVIPVRSHADLLAQALESVAAQGEAVAEVIVVDDGAVGGDAEAIAQVCRRAGVRRVRQAGRGAGAARNLGGRLARGTHLLFLDADDRLASGSVSALRDELGGTTSGTAALGLTCEFTDGTAAPTRAPVSARVRLLGAMLLPRRDFLALGGFDEDLGRGEGLDLMHRAQAGTLTVVDVEVTVLLRRLHAANGGIGGGTEDYLTVARRAIERNRGASR